MDRPLQITGPDTSADPMGERTQFQYDAAGRLTRTIAPQGVHSGIDKDHATDYSYDARDRLIKTTQYVLSGSMVTSTLNTLSCHDATRGDLPRVVAPKARLDTGTVHCSGTTVDPYTTQYGYDVAHRVTSTTDSTGAQTTTAYDADGNVLTATQTADRTVTPAISTTTTYTYDQADRQTVVQQTYDPTRTLTTKVQYDAAGNTIVVAPPRATNANPGLGNYANAEYAATYHYEVANRLTQIDLPNAPGSTQQYVLRQYDRLGRLTLTSLPDSITTNPNTLTTHQKTVVDYYDNGLIRTQTDQDHPTILYEYTAEVYQSARKQQVGRPSISADRRPSTSTRRTGGRTRWTGCLTTYVTGLPDSDQRNVYSYDVDNQVSSATLSGGRATPDTPSIPVTARYDSLDRPAKVAYTKANQPGTFFTSWQYDANGNVQQQEIDGLDPAASTGKVQTYGYDPANRLTSQVDKAAPGAGQPDQQYAFSWFDTGWLRSRAVQTNTGAQLLKSGWDYFLAGQVQRLTTVDGGSATVEQHVASYDDPGTGKHVGFRTQDQFAVASPGPGQQCATFASLCTATYTYDPCGQRPRFGPK